MAYDIRISTDYLDHHKVLRLIDTHGESAVLAHIRLMLYAREHRPDGIFTGMCIDDICLIIRNECTNVSERTSVVDTMVKTKLLNVSEDGIYSLHDWSDHNSYSVESVEKSDVNRFSVLAKHYPEKHKDLSDKGIYKISKSDYERIKSEYERKANVPTKRLPPVPNPTQNPEPNPEDKTVIPDFIDSSLWDAFIEVRKKLKAANTERAINMLLKELTEWHEEGENVNEIISTSIKRSWKGVFKPDSKKSKYDLPEDF